MNAFDQIDAAVRQARDTQNAANAHTRSMAQLIAGNLQIADVPHYTLKKLKDELRRYNPHTNSWRPAK